MSEYHRFYNIWKSYTSKKMPLNEITGAEEIDDAEAAQIYNWAASKGPENYSFDNLFGDKMRFIIPLVFDAKNIKDPDTRESFDKIKALIRKSEIWKYDNDSLSRSSVYKIKQPKDFGPKENIERYGRKTPPPGKRVEQKISKFLSRLEDNAVKKDLPTKHLIKKLSFMWDKKSGIEIAPQGSIIISRHPVDVARMSDFSGLQSCHAPPSVPGDSSYYQCAVKESRGNAPVAYFVSKKALDSFLGDKDIGDFDKEEIFADPKRGVNGINPAARIRFRKISGDTSGDEEGYVEEFEIAIPEVVLYGNEIAHFQDTINNWAYEKQADQFFGNNEIFKKRTWREEYIRLNLEVETEEKRSYKSDKNIEKKKEKIKEIERILKEAYPGLDRGDVTFHGGTYKDTKAPKLFENFFGLEEWTGDNEVVATENIFSEDFLNDIAKKYFSDYGYTVYDWKKKAVDYIEKKRYMLIQKIKIKRIADRSDNRFEDYIEEKEIKSELEDFKDRSRQEELVELLNSIENSPEMKSYYKWVDSLQRMKEKFKIFNVEITHSLPEEDRLDLEYLKELKDDIENDSIDLNMNMNFKFKIENFSEEDYNTLEQQDEDAYRQHKIRSYFKTRANQKILNLLGGRVNWEPSDFTYYFFDKKLFINIDLVHSFVSFDIGYMRTKEKFETLFKILKNYLPAEQKAEQIKEIILKEIYDAVNQEDYVNAYSNGKEESLNERISRSCRKKTSLKIYLGR